MVGVDEYGDLTLILDDSVPGYQTDGTFVTPAAAQQVNNPANTAGYSSPMSDSTLKLLTQGISTLGTLGSQAMMLDYRRYEATNGGLFMQGYAANGMRATQVSPNFSALLILGAAIVLMVKD